MLSPAPHLTHHLIRGHRISEALTSSDSAGCGLGRDVSRAASAHASETATSSAARERKQLQSALKSCLPAMGSLPKTERRKTNDQIWWSFWRGARCGDEIQLFAMCQPASWEPLF